MLEEQDVGLRVGVGMRCARECAMFVQEAVKLKRETDVERMSEVVKVEETFENK
jgi:hypothetical protein